MQFGTFAYPWDLIDEGVEDVVSRLRDLGIGEINLATNYHSVQAFLPHNPERRTFFSHASAFFQPTDEYADLRPVPNRVMGERCWLTEIAEELPADICLNSWTIGCHNTQLGMRNPECTLTTPHGDDLIFGLCPSNPRVQRYLLDLVSDLDRRDLFDRIELESFDYFHGRGFGWHHDKFHTQLGDLGEFLFGVCFCKHCRERAAANGIDVSRVRETCRDAIDDLADGQLSSAIDPDAWLRAYPETEAYLGVREETLTEVFADIRAAVDSELGYFPILPAEKAWMHGADLNRLSEHLDYIKILAYEDSGTDAREAAQLCNRLVPDVPLHAGVLPAHPHVYNKSTAHSVVDGVIEGGAERVSFYNYGMLPERNLDWIGDITATYE